MAAMYKWTDANGRVIYSDQPPPGNVKVETINAPPRRPTRMPSRISRRRKPSSRRRSSIAPTRKPSRTRRASRPTCASRNANGRGVKRSPSRNPTQVVLYTTTPTGERVAMNDAARLAERQRLDYWIHENCQNQPTASTTTEAPGRRPARGAGGAMLLLLEIGLVDLDLRLGLERIDVGFEQLASSASRRSASAPPRPWPGSTSGGEITFTSR